MGDWYRRHGGRLHAAILGLGVIYMLGAIVAGNLTSALVGAFIAASQSLSLYGRAHPGKRSAAVSERSRAVGIGLFVAGAVLIVVVLIVTLLA